MKLLAKTTREHFVCSALCSKVEYRCDSPCQDVCQPLRSIWTRHCEAKKSFTACSDKIRVPGAPCMGTGFLQLSWRNSGTCTARHPSRYSKPAGVSGSTGASATKISIQKAAALQGPFTGCGPSLPAEMKPKLPNVPRESPQQGGLPHACGARGGTVKSCVQVNETRSLGEAVPYKAPCKKRWI